MESKLLKAAQWYQKRGFSVIPVRQNKKPYIKWEKYQSERAEPDQIEKWWQKWPEANIGIVTGKISGIDVVDCDSEKGRDALKEFLADSLVMPISKTPKGWHYFFKHSPGLSNGVRVLKDCDLRTSGGYVVMPPSKNGTGQVYAWLDGFNIAKVAPAAMPAMLFDILQAGGAVQNPKTPSTKTKNIKRSVNKPGWVDEALMGVNQGKRNQTCAKLAGYYLRSLKGDIEGTFAILKDWNQRFNKPPLNDKEVQKVVESISTRQGLNELTEIMRTDIYQMEILNYPDGDTNYRIYIDGLDKHATLTSDDIVNSRRFRAKLVGITKRVMRPIKDPQWFDLIDKVLSEATEIQMGEDETKLAVIRRIILSGIQQGEHKEPEKFINGSIVVYKENIHLYLDVIERQLRFMGIRIKNSKELGGLLRIMGFVNRTARLHSKILKTWQLKKALFLQHSEEISGNVTPSKK